MRTTLLLVAVIFATDLGLALVDATVRAGAVYQGLGAMAGKVTDSTVILQSRLTKTNRLVDGDLPGSPGIARFEIATEPDFQDVVLTDWIEATPHQDYIVKAKVAGLNPDTRYVYRLRYGASRESTQLGRTCSFKTMFVFPGAHLLGEGRSRPSLQRL